MHAKPLLQRVHPTSSGDTQLTDEERCWQQSDSKGDVDFSKADHMSGRRSRGDLPTDPSTLCLLSTNQVMSADTIQESCTRLTISTPELGLACCVAAVSKVAQCGMGASGSSPKAHVTHPHVRAVCLISDPADLDLEGLAVFVSHLVQAVGMER